MNVVVWARVSSREQREGYSIDAQLRANREKAAREGWKVVREFVVAESAKRGAGRAEFNQMYAWVRRNAGRDKIDAILSHKLDRVCRNMRDAVRLQELEDTCGVLLAFVENQFGPGAAGQLSFNVMAAVAQYYSDNLQTEVLKGMDEKVRQGWLPAHAPYGYRNVQGDREVPIQPDPEKARTVQRIFELYARGNQTFKSLAETLHREGHLYSDTQPRFPRTVLSYLLNNRFYVGDIVWHGQVYPGKHQPLVSRRTFQACQDVLSGRNRRTGQPEIPYSGGLFRCAHCGAAITGENIRRKLKGGGVKEHFYYKCRNTTDPAHPKVRWRQEDVERAVEEELRTLELPPQAAGWFREALGAAFADVTDQRRRRRQALLKRQTELKAMQDRLLTGYLQGTIDEATFTAKSAEMKAESAQVGESLEQAAHVDAKYGEMALATFDFGQQAARRWRGSNFPTRRRILDCVSSNRTLSDVSLCVTKRKPFDVLAEGLSLIDGRGDWI